MHSDSSPPPLLDIRETNLEGPSSRNPNTISDEGTFVQVSNTYSFDDMPQFEFSVSVVLQYCKRKVLLPYFRLLSLLGWRPLINLGSSEMANLIIKTVNIFYTLSVILFIFTGYILQYAACFRRTEFPVLQETIVTTEKSANISVFAGTKSNSVPSPVPSESSTESLELCSSDAASVYFLPDVIHLAAYLYTLYQMRIPECEQLETLMERVFLQLSLSQAWHFSQKRVVRRLRFLLGMGFCWLLLSILSQAFHAVSSSNVTFTWIHPNSEVLRVVLFSLMLASVTWNDVICIAIATSYTIHCQLIISCLQNLCQAVTEKHLIFQQFYKEIQEARKSLKYLNDKLAVSVSLLILNFVCQSTSGLYGLISGSNHALTNVFECAASLISICLWLALIVFPIFQAVRLTEVCGAVTKLGHEIRARPFGYRDTPQKDLDSFLLYTSTLTMQARIFRVPVRASCLLLVVVCIAFIIVVMGQLGMIRSHHLPY